MIALDVLDNFSKRRTISLLLFNAYMNSHHRFIVFAILLAFFGCGRAFGPEKLPTTTISGKVHFADQPVKGGWLEIVPPDGGKGRLRSIPIGTDGSFRGEKIPLGRVAIRVAGAPINVGQTRPFEPFRRAYLIRRTIEPSDSIDIDLWSELGRLERLKAPAPNP